MLELWNDGILLPALAIFLISAVLQGASGFGMALIAVPLLTLLMSPKMAVPATTLASVIVSGIIVVQLWRHCDWPRAAWLGIPALLTAPFGVHLLKVLTSEQLCLGLGVVLVLSAVVSLLAQRRAQAAAGVVRVVVLAEPAAGSAAAAGVVPDEPVANASVRTNPAAALAVGGVSGVLGGALGMTGPLLADYLNKSGIHPDEFRITLNLIFLASSVWRMGLYMAQGVLTGPTWWLAAAAIPVAVGGALLGGVLGRRIRRETFVIAVNWMLLFIGIGMLIQSQR